MTLKELYNKINDLLVQSPEAANLDVEVDMERNTAKIFTVLIRKPSYFCPKGRVEL